MPYTVGIIDNLIVVELINVHLIPHGFPPLTLVPLFASPQVVMAYTVGIALALLSLSTTMMRRISD
jgi:hypothetical protein